MNFLSIDCSTDIGSLFLKAKNKTFLKILQSDKSNNDLLMQQILDLFKESNIKFREISQIYVNQGPGNFSGLRASIAIAKGISLSNNLNLFGYDTFIWSCSKFINKEDFIYSFINFRKKFFVKKFDKNLNSIWPTQEITLEEIKKNYEDKFKIIPKSMILQFDEKILNLDNLNIAGLDHNDLEFLQLNSLLDRQLIKPLYLS